MELDEKLLVRTAVAQYYGDVLLALGMSADLNPRLTEHGEADISARDFAARLRAKIEEPLRIRLTEGDASPEGVNDFDTRGFGI